MSDDRITIEVDGKPLPARKGQMLIEVTDQNDIYVPRFCYHDKLSVAANCRMCLVDVEKAPKPLPACATPVMDGMVVRTRSALALGAQKSVMEFLLINHPLDCPICDQGGECELQDLAMGFGSDVSQYQEAKRVVKDKDIGPLVQTDMTRCIHCTRCVRFGEEIAGLRELGATGRGENMTIGTYVEKSMNSELSGNVIDLCPVGALTSKPFRYSARAWEMQQRRGIAPHDCLGSNVEVHIHNNRIKRVVPGANEAVNEVWLSDRDRFSYEGLYSEDRLLRPMLKNSEGQWQEIDWSEALPHVADRLQQVRERDGAGRIGALVSASSTNEEYYLLQKVLRGFGCHNIDHRLRQTDFSYPQQDGLFPWLGQGVSELELNDAILIVGSEPRREVPLINHRIRKAALKGARVMTINPLACDFNFDLESRILCRPSAMAHHLAALLKAAFGITGTEPDNAVAALINAVECNEQHQHMAQILIDSSNTGIILGDTVQAHPHRALVDSLVFRLAELTSAKAGYLPDGANSAGAWLAGIVPHRSVAGQPAAEEGLHAAGMIEQPLSAYILYNIEPGQDCINPAGLTAALQAADFVVAFSGYRSEELESVADMLLPVAQFAENEGSFVNVEGRVQDFNQAIKPAEEIRPGWRAWRILGNELGLDGFDYQSIADVQADILPAIESAGPATARPAPLPASLPPMLQTLERITLRPIYAVDALVRRGKALQQTAVAGIQGVMMNRITAEQLHIQEGEDIHIEQDAGSAVLPLILNESVADGCCYIPAGQPAVEGLAHWFGPITAGKAQNWS